MDKIPRDILIYIFQFLHKEYKAVSRFVCLRWKSILPPIKEITCRNYFKFIGKNNLLDYVYKKGCPISQRDLHQAVKSKNLTAVKWILSKGIKPNKDMYYVSTSKEIQASIKMADLKLYMENTYSPVSPCSVL